MLCIDLSVEAARIIDINYAYNICFLVTLSSSLKATEAYRMQKFYCNINERNFSFNLAQVGPAFALFYYGFSRELSAFIFHLKAVSPEVVNMQLFGN
jgi:hypothetical protein